MIKLLVFDFDGTLADTKKLLLDLIRKNLGRFNSTISKEFLDDFGDEPLEEALDAIGIHEKVLASLVENIEFSFLENVKKVRPVKNLQSLSKINKKKIILSNSIHEFVALVLKKEGADFFDEIHGCDDFSSKIEEFRKILKAQGLKPGEAVYIGDRPIDVQLAREVKCYSVIVSNKSSWSSKSRVLEAEPDFIISDLGQLEKVINKLDANLPARLELN